ncbi:MAG: hypothetical protein ABW162_15915 [Candidatus Sedimenticola sp. PURPLELP]
MEGMRLDFFLTALAFYCGYISAGYYFFRKYRQWVERNKIKPELGVDAEWQARYVMGFAFSFVYYIFSYLWLFLGHMMDLSLMLSIPLVYLEGLIANVLIEKGTEMVEKYAWWHLATMFLVPVLFVMLNAWVF